MPKIDKENMNLFAPLSTTVKPQVLLVDDNPDNLILLQLMLEEIGGYQISTASGGQQALKLVRVYPPDLILLDLMMPDMNGIEVANRLRSDPKTQDIPIVLVTAYHDLREEDCQLVDGVLVKPIEEDKLFSLLNLLINT